VTSDRPSPSDFDDEERRFLADLGVPDPDAPPHRDCPRLPLLLAAHEGALPQDQQSRVDAHLASCPFCRSLVQDVEDAGLGAPMAEELERIRARVRAHAAPEPAPVRVPVQAAGRWTSPPPLALAASLLAVVSLGLYTLSLQRKGDALERTVASLRDASTQGQQRVAALEGQVAALREQVERPGGEANVPVVDLEPLGARRSDEASRSFTLPQNARFVTLILQVNGAGNAGNVDVLTVEVHDARGELRWSFEGLRPSAAGIVTVLAPRGVLPDGDAVVTLVRTRDGRRLTVAEYRARFARP
jgi:hypothetical protein